MPDDLQQVMEAAVRQAGSIMISHTGRRVAVEFKQSWSDLVTEVDRAAEEAVKSLIHSRFPDHGLVGEEGGGGWEREYTWVLDPLDGTTNFAHTLPNYACSLACFRGSEPLVAAVYDPNRDELFTARRGGGATLNGSPVTVDPAANLRESVIGTNLLWDLRTGRDPNLPGLLLLARDVRGIRSIGSAALELAYVACGRYTGFAQHSLAPWDFAAGALLVEEAGGRVTQRSGAPLDPQRPCSVVASNGRIHAEMLERLKP